MHSCTAHAEEDTEIDGCPAGPCSPAAPDTVRAVAVMRQAEELFELCKLLSVHLHRDALGFSGISGEPTKSFRHLL